ncbi:MAG: PHP domain-containing protein [Bacteroidetes bacterium]|nr:PHP domain-containing protein [Bacteroidota bacterium]
MNNLVDIVADMHCHTTCSDGLLTPSRLMEKAEAVGLGAISITDHDTLAAYDVLRMEGYNGPVTLIPGIEVSCTEDRRDVHVLGYYIDHKDPTLRAYIDFFKTDRERRAREMVERLQRLRVNISFDEVQDHAGTAPIGRPHVAAVMVQRGFSKNLQNAFDVYLDTGKPAFVSKAPYSVKMAADMIHGAGGIAVIAHPGKTYHDPRLFLGLRTSGIDGVEVYHPSHWYVTREYYKALALQHGLLITGGSDYHGSREYDERNLGVFGVTQEHLDAIREKIHAS